MIAQLINSINYYLDYGNINPALEKRDLYYDSTWVQFGYSGWGGTVIVVVERATGGVEAFHAKKAIVEEAMDLPTAEERLHAIMKLKPEMESTMLTKEDFA